MGRPYSQDLRERLVEAAAVTQRRHAAAGALGRFDINLDVSAYLTAAD